GIEAATVTVDPDGTARCSVSFPTQGQGHATTIAQLVADRLGVAIEHVRLEPGDTSRPPRGRGAFGSRGTVAMLGSAGAAADRVAEKIRALAADRLEASATDVVLTGGRAVVRAFADPGASASAV